MGEAVDWGLAERIAVRIASQGQRADAGGALQAQFDELTAEAQVLVEAETGWRSEAGAARARVVSRPDWVRANISSFRRLLAPLTRTLEHVPGGPAQWVGSKFAAAELGGLLGWMSTKVLGQYDLLVAETESVEDQDLVYFVGPNLLALEERFDFPQEEFRLWVALHEVTHRTQFTGKPWLREHFLGLTEQLMTLVEPDPGRIFDVVGRVAEGLRTRTNPLDEGGLAGLFAGPEQLEVMGRVGGLMSLLEGHGDVVMDRAGGARTPNAARFSDTLHARRESSGGLMRLVQKLIGFEAKLRQYAEGERFIEHIERVGGPSLLQRAFEGPASLPSMVEVRDPQAWVERMRATALVG